MPDPTDAVIRFGLMQIADLARSARTHRLEEIEAGRADPRYALSVFSLPGLPGGEVARNVGLPHPVYRESTVERLASAGFELTDCDQEGHCLIPLPDPPTEEDWARLSACFAPPQENPARRNQ